MEDLPAGAGTVRGGVEDGVPEIQGAGKPLLVGRDDVDALFKEERVRVCDVLVGGVVDEDDGVPGLGEVVC